MSVQHTKSEPAWRPARVAVMPGATGDEAMAHAASTAGALDLPLVIDAALAESSYDLLLIAGGSRLALRETGSRPAGAIFVDFVKGATAYRRLSGTSRRQPLATALGLRTGTRTVVDATAGLGADAFLMASLGCSVTAVERSPIIAALLADGLARAKNATTFKALRDATVRERAVTRQGRKPGRSLRAESDPDVPRPTAPRSMPASDATTSHGERSHAGQEREIATDRGACPPADIVDRIRLVVADARHYLAGLAADDAPDAVYLDPMYVARKRTTVVRKEMRICRRLVGDDTDAGELLEIARGVARRRVVVKRHRLAPPLAPNPARTCRGSNVRYDVY